MNIDHPEHLFDLFHSGDRVSGKVVFTRRIGSRYKRTQVPVPVMRNIAKQVYDLPDIYFSSVSFNGLPLLLNLESVPCIAVRVLKEDQHTFNTVLHRLNMKGIPLPTICIDDGAHLHILWFTHTPLRKHEFYIASIIKKAFTAAITELSPEKDSINIGNALPLVGSINSQTGKYVGIRYARGEKYNTARLYEAALNLCNGLLPERMVSCAGRLLELQAIFHNRALTLSLNQDLYKDWILFIGSALSVFCTPDQVILELRALTESLTGQPWGKIQADYNELVQAIAKDGANGFIYLDGSHYSVSHIDWNDTIRGKLKITEEEIIGLNLQQIGNNKIRSPYIEDIGQKYLPVGNDDFVAKEVFCIKVA